MANTIRRSLYIGLGGTGMKTLLRTKKSFIDTYGEVPPMVAFLGIDTDKGQFATTLRDRWGNEVQLDPNECMQLEVSGAINTYRCGKAHYSWLDHYDNVNSLNLLQNLGAGQIRTNGRFCLTVNSEDIKKKIKDCLNDISNIKDTLNKEYSVLSTSAVDVHMVFSVGGGTGCGTFIDTAYMVREQEPTCKITGYAVLPEIFRTVAGNGSRKVKANAYGAILDLDYLMSLNEKDKPVSFDWLHSKFETTSRPFNAFFFIDNKDASGNTYTDAEQIYDTISLAMLTASGDLSVNAASVSDNIEHTIAKGEMDIENKKAWVSTLGVSEICYRSHDLARLYQMRASQWLIRSLSTANIDTALEANTWIDNTHIRENNDHNDVIDELLNRQSKYPLADISEPTSPENEVDQWTATATECQKELDEKLAIIQDRTSKALADEIARQSNQAGGVANTMALIKAITNIVDACNQEMNDELDKLEKHTIPGFDGQVKEGIEDLKDYAGKLFHVRSGVQDRVEDLLSSVNERGNAMRDRLRHQSAIQFYNWLRQQLNTELQRFNDIQQRLDAAAENISKQEAAIRNSQGVAKYIFRIDLTERSMNDVKVGNIDFGSFVNWLKAEGYSVHTLGALRTHELERLLLRYTETLAETSRLDQTSINDVLQSLSEDELNDLTDNALRLSSEMLSFDRSGYQAKEPNLASFYYVGVNDHNNSPFLRDDHFKERLADTASVSNVEIGQRDRIIIYHQIGVVPPYQMRPINSCCEEYDKQTSNTCTFHFDNNLLQRMQGDRYSIYPADTSLEQWVCGLLVGHITYNEGAYYVKSMKKGDSLDNYRYRIGATRDEAYNNFCNEREDLRADNEAAVQQLRNKTVAELRGIIEQARQSAYYIQHYGFDITDLETLRRPQNEQTRELMGREIDYLNKDFNIC